MKNKIKSIIFFAFFIPLLSFSQSENFDSLLVEFDSVKKETIIDGEDRKVFDLLEDLYKETLQSNKGGISKKTIAKYIKLSADTELKNKNILFLFNTYQNYISETLAAGKITDPLYQQKIMNLLSFECISIYNQIPAIVFIYMGEALMNNKESENAIQHFDLALGFYPSSIPMKIYKFLLDEENNKELKDELIKKHSKHWMVKQNAINFL